MDSRKFEEKQFFTYSIKAALPSLLSDSKETKSNYSVEDLNVIRHQMQPGRIENPYLQISPLHNISCNTRSLSFRATGSRRNLNLSKNLEKNKIIPDRSLERKILKSSAGKADKKKKTKNQSDAFLAPSAGSKTKPSDSKTEKSDGKTRAGKVFMAAFSLSYHIELHSKNLTVSVTDC